MDFKDENSIEYRIQRHIQNGIGYAKFSPIEKFRYVDKMMKLSRNYYCDMFNIPRYINKFGQW
jgi:hypothetical protein